MREITDHKVNGLNEALTIEVTDEPGNGGANHAYSITLEHGSLGKLELNLLRFQNGPLKEAGINGISNEALIAVAIDRLRGFQGGAYATREGALALTNLEQAVMWLHKRTRDRVARGVEGTHIK